jgi:hypothetical protein
MNRSKIRMIAAAAALTLTAILAVPGFSATSPGSISLKVPDSFSRDSVAMTWTYKAGTLITNNSQVDVLTSSNGATWSPLALRVPIRNLGYNWNISNWNDAVYAVRLRIAGTSTYSATDYAYVDHTNPNIEITHPSRNDITVDDASVATLDAVVAGRTTLKANANDALSGVETVVWELDGNPIATGGTAVYDFTASPGRHELAAVASDFAGNTASASITVVALPGSAAATPPGDTPDPNDLIPTPDPTTIPSPDPSTLPTLPPIPSPDPTVIPSPDPTAVPSPDPTILPTPLPTLTPLP